MYSTLFKSKLFTRAIVDIYFLQGLLSEKVLSPKNCSFEVISLALIFFQVTKVFGKGHWEEDLFEVPNFYKGNTYFFQNTTQSRRLFKLVFHFIWQEELWAANHSFRRASFFWRISLSHPFSHVQSGGI